MTRSLPLALLLVELAAFAFVHWVVPVTSEPDPKDNAVIGFMHPRHRKRNCLEQPLDERVKRAELIFTGTVRSSQRDSFSSGTHTVYVQVKRFLKGGPQDAAERLSRPVLQVSGIGDDVRLCQSHARLHDSWIFLASRDPASSDRPGALHLNSSLIAVTLENIDSVDATVRRFEVKTSTTKNPQRPSTTPRATTTNTPAIDPCLSMSCAHHSRCVVSGRNGQTARCECPVMRCSNTNGNSLNRGRLCGSDGNDYENECEMIATSCREQQAIVKKYDGYCDSCRGKHCEFHGICIIDNRGGSQCVCPEEKYCNTEPTVKVCGSNGEFYESDCVMRITSCRLRQRITVSPTVVCDRCAEVECFRRGEVCVEGTCVCRQTPCPAIYSPVCGSDSVTYPNQCKLDEVACMDDRDIDTLHEGACIDDGFGSGFDLDPPTSSSSAAANKRLPIDDGEPQSGPVARLRCDDSLCSHGAICEAIGHKQTHRCVCRFSCDALRSAVCGSDGTIYASECEMKETACHKQIAIAVQPIGNCEDTILESELCDGKPTLVNPLTDAQYDCNREQCPAGSYCHRIQSAARCCPAGLEASPTSCDVSRYGCCSDGVTSARGPNHAGCPDKCCCNALGSIDLSCDPKTRQCRCKNGVGGRSCDHCETTYWGMHLIRDINPGCIPCGCNEFGSERDDCDQMTGRCVCQPGMKGHKCNICPNGAHVGLQGCLGLDLMQKTEAGACPRRRCSHGSVCDVTSGQCKCPYECDVNDEQTLVCGSNGRTYRSKCEMNFDSCQRKRKIHVVQNGSC